MKNLKLWMTVAFGLLLIPLYVFAQEAAEAVKAAVEVAPAAVPMATEPSVGDIFQQIMKAIGDWKAIGWQAGLAGILTVLISTMKNSLLREWVWSKVPEWAKVLVAPLLSIIIFALGMGSAFDAKAFFAALTTGAAAVFLHQLLDGLKKAPFIKEWMKSVIDFIAKLLKKPEVSK